jgi:hypothetical protein
MVVTFTSVNKVQASVGLTSASGESSTHAATLSPVSQAMLHRWQQLAGVRSYNLYVSMALATLLVHSGFIDWSLLTSMLVRITVASSRVLLFHHI